MFLTCSAGHGVCPSEEVDAVWHQHLTYSRSYWNDLCRDTLGYPLHHDPTAGGPADSRKHWAMYRQTLASYRRIFGEDAPRDIWPPPLDRFDPNSQSRTLDTGNYWIVRKPFWWPRRVVRQGRFAALLFPLVAVWLGPLDWPGPDFLALFAGLYAALMTGAIVYRCIQRSLPVMDDRDLMPEEIASLTLGRPAAVNATIAGMLHEQQLISILPSRSFGRNDGAKTTFSKGNASPRQEQSLATSIYRAVEKRPETLKWLQLTVAFETDAIDQHLQSAGYILDKSRSWSVRMIPGFAMLTLLALGLLKLWVGFQRGRPIGFLVIGCLVVLLTALILMKPVRRSLAGDRLVQSLRTRHADLKSKVLQPGCAGEQVVLCAALFGVAALQRSIFKDLAAAWRAKKGGDGGWSSYGCGGGYSGIGIGCSSGGGSGCSSGGSGCGGGGGCGGCGGGS